MERTFSPMIRQFSAIDGLQKAYTLVYSMDTGNEDGCCLTLCRTGNRQYMQSCYIAAAPEFCYRILRYLCENGVQPEIWQDVVEELTDTEQLRQNGGRLLEQLRQGRQFDVVILCSQLEDMSGLEFLMNIRSMDPKPNVVLFDEGRRQNTSAICLESGDGFCYVGHAELKNLLWELYRLPGRQSQRIERKCQELYEGWGIQLPDVNCNYLSCAVGVVYGTSQKLAIRKEILQAVSEQYDVSVSAVDSGIRRMIDQLEAKPSVKWLRFKEESGFADEKPTTGKLIYTVKNYLQRQKDD